jgi:hypothetical protein
MHDENIISYGYGDEYEMIEFDAGWDRVNEL